LNLSGEGNTFSSQPPNLLTFYKTIGRIKREEEGRLHKKRKVKKREK